MLLGPYSDKLQVLLGVVFAELFDRTSCLHSKVRRQGSVLNGNVVFKGASDRDAVCVDYDDADYAFVRADPLQRLFYHSNVPHGCSPAGVTDFGVNFSSPLHS